MNMILEKLINVKIAMLKNKPKSEVRDKYLEYMNEYDKECRSIRDKVENSKLYILLLLLMLYNLELFYSYLKYIEK
jgi:hypothetical protein